MAVHLVNVYPLTLEALQTVGQNVQLILTVHLVKPVWEKNAETHAQVLAVSMLNVQYSITFLCVLVSLDTPVILSVNAIN